MMLGSRLWCLVRPLRIGNEDKERWIDEWSLHSHYLCLATASGSLFWKIGNRKKKMLSMEESTLYWLVFLMETDLSLACEGNSNHPKNQWTSKPVIHQKYVNILQYDIALQHEYMICTNIYIKCIYIYRRLDPQKNCTFQKEKEARFWEAHHVLLYKWIKPYHFLQ